MAPAGLILLAFLFIPSSGVNGQKPSISIIPPNGEIQLGQSAFFLCKVSSGGEATFQWINSDGEKLEDDEEHYQRKDIDESAVGLTIMAEGVEQSGEVRCHAKFESDDEAEDIINIQVIQKLTFAENQDTFREFDKGSDAELQCSATGIPKPQITWFHNGENITQHRDDRISVPKRGTLQIRRVQLSDAGMYSCRASIESRNEVDQKTFTLSVNVPPSAHFKNKSITVMGGTNSSASLICLVTGSPQPKITWSSAGKQITAVEGKYALNSDGSELRIHYVDKADEGDYNCTARNKLGQEVATFSLQVLEVQLKGIGIGVIVAIVMVIFLVVLLVVDVSCYYTNKRGILMCLAVNLLGKHPHGGKSHILEDRKTAEKSSRSTVVNVSGIEA